ncbi:MAG TPA: hypothetical protein VFW53_05070 [Gallionella sp.]|nr:hypothetical protein [Gallionella sp.]
MRAAGQSALLIGALALVGCDRISGVEEQKMLDAEAIGYACRVSLKTPEDCMKENEAQSPTSVLGGWKSADKDIKEKKLDPTMGKRAGSDLTAHSGTAATDAEAKAATDNAAEKNGDAKSETDKKKTNR